MKKKSIVISGINFFEGGPLSIMRDCLIYLESSQLVKKYSVLALVSELSFYADMNLKNIRLIQFPKSRRAYFWRFYYEFWYFKKFAEAENVVYWLSLHDISPRLKNVRQSVYCHNPSPFYSASFKDFVFDPTFGLFTIFYSLIYRINIKRNEFVIVQQSWLRDEFCKIYNLKKEKIIVAHPVLPFNTIPNKSNSNASSIFIFPSFPRVFKNIAIICEAVKLLNNSGVTRFEVMLTIDGTENRYAKFLRSSFGHLKNIKWLGKQSRDSIFNLYANSTCLIFPSKLETWGLPISEFKLTNKPILVADLPYAHETVGDYKQVVFFDPNSSKQLADCMERIITSTVTFSLTNEVSNEEPFAENWEALFNKLLER